MKCPFCIKICTQCKKLLVANKVNFTGHKKMKYGVSSKCKNCENENRRNKYKNDLDYKEKTLNRNKNYYEENKEELQIKHKEHYSNNKDTYIEKAKEYYKNNKEKIQKQAKERYYNDIELSQSRNKENYNKHKEQRLKYMKEYNIKNPEVAFNSKNKRRIREEEQGSGITKEQWKEMMDFFNWQCAYSGESLNGNNKERTIDHIIPLAKNGQHEVWNLVPMKLKYNSSKHTNDMEEWYKNQPFYSDERLDKIYTWQKYAYYKWSDKDGKKEKEK